MKAGSVVRVKGPGPVTEQVVNQAMSQAANVTADERFVTIQQQANALSEVTKQIYSLLYAKLSELIDVEQMLKPEEASDAPGPMSNCWTNRIIDINTCSIRTCEDIHKILNFL